MKRRIILSASLLILLAVLFYLNLLMPIITGYAAKNLASAVFVAGRSQEAMEREDLNFSFIKWTSNTVDMEKKEVSSQFLWGKSKAVYTAGFGCTLVEDFSEDEIKSRLYQLEDTLPVKPDTLAWPMGDLITTVIPDGVDLGKLNRAVIQAMSDTIPYKGTFALNVVYKGQLIVEEYRNDFSASNRFLSWSMAKSFVNTLVGLRVKEGKMDILKPLKIKEWQEDERHNISMNSLMQMNSGLEWNENYGNLSDVTIMLHKEGDMGLYTQNKPYQYPVGSIWVYSSGSTNLACSILRNSFERESDYFQFPRKALFNKIGMKSAVFEVDASGTFVGSSYLYANMRDYARFGLLYLNDGNWLGKQLLPIGWVDYTTEVATGSEGRYGSFFWLNQSLDYPDAPRDMFLSKGHDGQYICIIPSKQLVVVRTGYSKPGEFDLNGLLKAILASIE